MLKIDKVTAIVDRSVGAIADASQLAGGLSHNLKLGCH